jgi:amino acid transporter
LNRSGKIAAIMVALFAASLILLFVMPAESDVTIEVVLTYASVGLYVVALALVGAVVYYRRAAGANTSVRSAPVEEAHEEYEDEISEIEREFEALEKEIEREETS